MRFAFVKLCAVALVASFSVSAEESRAMPQLRGASQLVQHHHHHHDKATKDDAFFPKPSDDENMDEEDRSDKKKASQKRQDQRDQRRSRTNPNRSQSEEQRERERKHNQSKSRGNRCVDPSEPGCGNDNYPRNREAKRQYRCDRNGEHCGYGRVDPDDEPNRRRADRDMNCMDDCKYDDDGYRRSSDERERCIRRECASDGKWKNGAATLGEYLDMMAGQDKKEEQEDKAIAQE